ncbi:VIT1/CCC1 transporter family protein [Clostridium algidicarnis]|uniref:VIT1/CCC1 transporter family protein n=1 Tax=Clostridium algidicarnis TaxID=37659 RepID=UPI001C0E5435|nr:VIT1/CCC1 transporter family protein [Clostridium algidicarnis]MBU3209442.1 VIT1/CCC1 transporter family protein [Clostridium algidicarnis]MBU3227303.1 VIT1/CCC1 transporter family protein [Clostridium algidicarnis]MBU3250826.1 VIT1/CCC1 transporter family protein [Clostridium algidicarnis]
MNDEKFMNAVKQLQIGEITEKEIYLKISKGIKDEKNRKILFKIADEEQKHHDVWKEYTKVNVKPSKVKVFYYTVISKILGYTFAIKKMEKRKELYNFDEGLKERLLKEIPKSSEVLGDEAIHEQELISIIDEERLQYVGSIVLGLNDALVEFTGSLAGYTYAMQNNKLISLVGLITGISATLSMASSEYLSSRSEGDEKPLRSAAYTGVAYLVTVIILVLPYLLLPDDKYSLALGIMLVLVISIIAAFNYYIAVAKDLSFKKRFGEMAGISLSVALLSFIIGLVVKKFLGVDI